MLSHELLVGMKNEVHVKSALPAATALVTVKAKLASLVAYGER